MILLIVSAAWVAVVAAMLARAIGQYRHYQVIGPVPDAAESSAPNVTVIVPARNEARSIGRCVEALSAQRYPRGNLKIIVVDDHSRDETAALVGRLARRDDRIRLISSEPLPPGWLGKPYACAQAVRHASGPWLCFVDADTIAEPTLIWTALRTATQHNLGLLSLQPFQDLVSRWERLILPCGFFVVAFTQDLRNTNDPSSPEASVNGQFLLVRREAYDAAGGHAAVRGQLAEDSALAANIKAAGFKVMVLGTRDLLHTRMYADFRALWEGAARQTATLLGASSGLFIASIAALLLAALSVALPIAAVFMAVEENSASHVAALVLSLAASLSLFCTHIGSARYFRIPLWYGLLFPVGYTIGVAVLLYAIWERMRGGIRWKGRIYPAAGENVGGPSGERAMQ
ncbi:MAG TPA: glycosyltransferase family A protein [Tepidisphaeraceae bacterium]|jgi:chlorobactene glucosyltransferase|nr:glycosyltransferase family A protein [Tepidisphaeraceae bacterium]